MAITANVDLGNGVTASSAYLIIPAPYVKKFEDGAFKLIYDVQIFKDKTDRDKRPLVESIKIQCRTVDHHKITYDPTTSDNPFKLAYADLKTNSSLSSVADA